jgi:hypothetical protein
MAGDFLNHTPRLFPDEEAVKETTPLLPEQQQNDKSFESYIYYPPRPSSSNEHIRGHDSTIELSGLPDLPSFSLAPHSKLKSKSFGSHWFQSWRRASRTLSLETSIQSTRSHRSPLVVFKDLLDMLLLYKVPGPTLYRTRREYNSRLGSGRTFEVLGASTKLLSFRDSALDSPTMDNSSEDVTVKTESVQRAIRAIPGIVIKRAYVDNQTSDGRLVDTSTESLTRAFGHQLVCVEREIENLCHPHLRGHPNIVKLVGWGLCLDTLEDTSAPEPRIPLLIVERAGSTLAKLIEIRGPLFCSDSCHSDHQLHISLLKDVGHGLDALHGAGLVHGDIKLDNILIFKTAERITAKLSDFGLTVAATRDASSSATLEYRGTPRWCPPSGSSRYMSSDLYSFDHFAFGLVVWCMFTNNARSPLPTDDRSDDDIDGPFSATGLYKTVVLDISNRHPELALPILMSLRACLHNNPKYWLRRPWQSLEGISYLQSAIYKTGVDVALRKFETSWSSSLRVTLRSATSLREWKPSMGIWTATCSFAHLKFFP